MWDFNKISVHSLRIVILWANLLAFLLFPLCWDTSKVYANTDVSLTLDTNQVKKTAKQVRSERRLRVMNSFTDEDPNAVDAFTHGFYWGLSLNTDGWRTTFRWQRTLNPRNAYHIQLDLSEIMDEHERTIVHDYFYSGWNYSNSAILSDGKINIFYPLRVGFGWNHYIVNKATHFKKGAFVQLFGNTGVILGIQKPYNIEIVAEDPNSPTLQALKVIDYNAETDQYYRAGTEGVFAENVRGRTFNAFFSGFDQISINPGLFLEGGLRIGFSKGIGFVSNVNIGLGIDLYAKEVPLVLDRNPRNFFYRAFIAFEIGNTKVKR